MSKLKFGDVTWMRYGSLSPQQNEPAVEFAAKYGIRAETRLDRLEFGMAGTTCMGFRVAPGDPGEPDPLAGEDDVETATCAGCKKRFPRDDCELLVCRICDDEFCTTCRDGHEWDCDRWE